MQIQALRLWDTIMTSGKIGPGRDQGLRRLALGDADKEMRDLFVTWCEAAGADRAPRRFAAGRCRGGCLQSKKRPSGR